ncbi:MAG: hypothetical protein ACOH2I_00585 [Pseudomonas sp.]
MIVIGALACCILAYIPICWVYDLRQARKRQQQTWGKSVRAPWQVGAKVLGIAVLTGGLGAGWWYGLMADTVQDMQQAEARLAAMRVESAKGVAAAQKEEDAAIARYRAGQLRDAGGFVKAQDQEAQAEASALRRASEMRESGGFIRTQP